jgi:hypothetical protein
MLRPCRDHCGCLAHQGVVDRYKGARAVPLARLHFPSAGLFCRRAPLKATAELLAPLAFWENARTYPFPLAPLKMPRPLVAQAELQACWSTRPRGRRRWSLQYTPSGHLPAASEHPNRARSTPSSSPATPRPSSPARSPEFHRSRRPKPQGLHCKTPSSSREFGGNQGHIGDL